MSKEEEDKKFVDDSIRDFASSINELQQKYVYYLLAVSAACIGYTINFTKNSQNNWYDILYWLSFILWGYSFFNGLKQLENKEMAYIYNILEFKAWKGTREKLTPKERQEYSKTRNMGVKYRKKQNYSLYLGVILFMLWYFFDKIIY